MSTFATSRRPRPTIHSGRGVPAAPDNQPDHELIDRRRPEVRRFLADLLSAEVEAVASDEEAVAVEAPAASGPWAEAARRWGIKPPDAEPVARNGKVAIASWSNSYAAVTDDPGLSAALANEGYFVLQATNPPSDLPVELAHIDKATP